MIDPISFAIGLLVGGFFGGVIISIVAVGRINRLEGDVYTRDEVIETQRRKLLVLTARDARGRFNGGKMSTEAKRPKIKSGGNLK